MFNINILEIKINIVNIVLVMSVYFIAENRRLGLSKDNEASSKRKKDTRSGQFVIYLKVS